MPRRCAYLTMSDFGDFVSDADLSFEPLAELGWSVEMVPWRSPRIDWNRYELVYLCTPWDYQDSVEEFLAVLDEIDASSAKLVNSLELVLWNLQKSYLMELERRGAEIVPSLFHESYDMNAVGTWFDIHQCDTIVVKPLVGANADHITVVTRPVGVDTARQLRAAYSARPFLVQPFMNSVQAEGEYSTFFFNGEFSHAILKKPEGGRLSGPRKNMAPTSLSVEAPAALIADRPRRCRRSRRPICPFTCVRTSFATRPSRYPAHGARADRAVALPTH